MRSFINRRQVYREYTASSQTYSKMQHDLENFVLNKNIRVQPRDYRQEYKKSHPEELITSDDVIHHINGNHDDNRIENLIKLTPKEHANVHATMWRAEREAYAEEIKEILP